MKQSIANKSILRSLTQSVAGEAEREASTKTLLFLTAAVAPKVDDDDTGMVMVVYMRMIVGTM